MSRRLNPVTSRIYIRKFSHELAQQCGKSPAWLYRDIIQMKKNSHMSLDEYRWTGCYALSEEQKKSVSTLWTRAEFRKRFTDKRYKGILTNKYFFSKVFSDYYGRTCLPASDVTIEKLRALSSRTGKVVIKPNCKGQGIGVRILPASTEQELEAAFAVIKTRQDGIAEEFIQQHSEMARINPQAVNIIRFYSLFSPAGVYLFAPVLTVANGKAIANGCQGALTAMIDIRDGVVITDAVDQNALVDYRVHPVTDLPFKGFQVPFWQETIEMMKKAVFLARNISNIGWDVAITDNGPLLIEANTIPGFNTAQYRGFGEVTDGYGYQPFFDEAMRGTPIPDWKHYERVVLKLG